MTKSKKALGAWGEQKALEYFKAKGYQVVALNVRTPYGEIDLIAEKENRLHFVEVKTRTTNQFGLPEKAITEQKFVHMLESAESYLQEHPEFEGDSQIDVIAIQTSSNRDKVDIHHFENVAV